MLKVLFEKLHKDAVIHPKSAKDDAGYDVGFVAYSVEGKKSGELDENGNIVYYTGIAIAMPDIGIRDARMQCLAFPKSSLSRKSLVMANSVGVVDFGYRGEISVKFKPVPKLDLFGKFSKLFFGQSTSNPKFEYGEAVVQLVFVPVFDVEFEIVTDIANMYPTDRGDSGYGEMSDKRYVQCDKGDIVS